jgi:hypothetical protein
MKYFLSLVLCLTTLNVFSQSPAWTWARGGGGSNDDQAVCVKSDLKGNVFVVGNYESTELVFDGDTLGKMASLGKFLCKYDSAGKQLWLKNIVGGGYASAIDIDQSGNVYVTGYFAEQRIVFGPDIISTDTNGSYDLFLLKYDTNGNPVWARTAGGADQEKGYCVKVDGRGAVYVAGSKGIDSFSFGGDRLKNTHGSDDVLLLKYDTAGHEIWARNSGYAFNAQVNSIAIDKAGSCYITGKYNGTPIKFDTATLPCAGDEDVFIVKYSPSGKLVWAKTAGGADKDWGQSLAVDHQSNLILTGSTASASFKFADLNLPVSAARWFDVYVMKMDTAGNVIWGKRYGGMDNERGNSVDVDAGGNIYVAGQFASNNFSFGLPWEVSSSGSYDIYLLKLDANGAFQWLKNEGGNVFDIASSVDVTPSGAVYICGIFISSKLQIPPYSFNNSGERDLFIARVNDPLGINSKAVGAFQAGISPNPFSNTIHVMNAPPGSTFKLLNAMGQTCWSGTEIEKQDFSKLAIGDYFLIIQTKEQSFVQQLIKKN